MGLTDYRARKRAVASRRVLLAVRISGKNVSAQFVRPRVGGDEVLVSVHSRSLSKLRWNGSLKSVPACYLLGLVAGKKASARGVKDAVLYNGLSPFIRSSRIAAFMKGAIDGGVQIPVSEDALPPEGRLSGEIIAKYASALLKDDKGAYQRRFSSLLRGGFKPEDYPAHFEETKRAILGGSNR